MPNHKPYAHVRLIIDDGPSERFEIRVSTFIEYDDNAGRRAISGMPSKKKALEQAQNYGPVQPINLDAGSMLRKLSALSP